MNPFLRVIEALNRHDVRYVIVGGFAAVMHGLDRATRDIDIYVDLAPQEARKAIDALLSIGMKSRAPVDPYDFADAAKREEWKKSKKALVFTMIDPEEPVFVVDLFVEAPMDTDALFARARRIRLGGHEAPICSLEDLIELKTKAGRPQDLLDVKTLRELQSRKPPPDQSPPR